MDPLNPLTEEHFAAIKNGIEQANQAIAAADKAASAGIDLSAVRAQAVTARDNLLRLKQVYFPGRA